MVVLLKEESLDESIQDKCTGRIWEMTVLCTLVSFMDPSDPKDSWTFITL